MNRFDVGGISHGRIGHDGGRVGVNQNHAEAFFTQGFTGLCARIVKLTGLANYNRTSANNQDAFNICAFCHGILVLSSQGCGGQLDAKADKQGAHSGQGTGGQTLPLAEPVRQSGAGKDQDAQVYATDNLHNDTEHHKG